MTTLTLSPQDLDLPPKFKKWKGRQEEAIERIVNSEKQLFLLDAPTGSGKSVIAIGAATIWRTNWLTTRRLEGDKVEDYELPKRVIYVTRTKQLQDQLLADFPNARTLKGRSNFPCLIAPHKFPDFTAEDCPPKQCPNKKLCPYLMAKKEALDAEIAVLNESYYLTEANGPGSFSDADFVILDEVDSIESTLMNHISMGISISTLEDFGLAPPVNWEDWSEWLQWWSTTATRRSEIIIKLELSQQTLFEPGSGPMTDQQIKKNRHTNKLLHFNENLNVFMQEMLNTILEKSGVTSVDDAVKITISGSETPFVVQERKDKKGNFSGWDLKPVSVRRFARQHLWRHAHKFLGMSGTILSPQVLARELGLYSADEYEYMQIPSPYEIKNRLIHYWPVANLRKQSIDSGEAMPKMLAAVDTIINRYPDQKGLIHTASYQIATAIQRAQEDNPRIMVHDTASRNDQLEAFKRLQLPMVMVSPSFDRGVDLPDDLCRFIVVCKIPYLNLGDRQVAARLKAPGGDQWYVFKAIQTLMQMTGRGVRNENDYCATYILDVQFNSLLARVKQYIPAWWLESIRRIEEL